MRPSRYAMCITASPRLNMLPLAAEIQTMTRDEYETEQADTRGGIEDCDVLDAYNQTVLTGHTPTINARLNQNNNIFVARVMEKEAQVMTAKRTEFGKAVRKAYESGEYGASRHDLTKPEPRTDGVSNTLTSVQKDNIVMEKDYRIGAMRGRGGEDGGEWVQRVEYNGTEESNTLTSVPTDNIVAETEAVAYDDYNGRFVPGQVTNAITTNIDSEAERNGQKVMITESERMESGGWEWDESRKAYVRMRFRKFTPRECFRLMDVTEDDIDRIQAAGISDNQQYKLAGNSIVVACLAGIFKNLFFPQETTDTLF